SLRDSDRGLLLTPLPYLNLALKQIEPARSFCLVLDRKVVTISLSCLQPKPRAVSKSKRHCSDKQQDKIWPRKQEQPSPNAVQPRDRDIHFYEPNVCYG